VIVGRVNLTQVAEGSVGGGSGRARPTGRPRSRGAGGDSGVV